MLRQSSETSVTEGDIDIESILNDIEQFRTHVTDIESFFSLLNRFPAKTIPLLDCLLGSDIQEFKRIVTTYEMFLDFNRQIQNLNLADKDINDLGGPRKRDSGTNPEKYFLYLQITDQDPLRCLQHAVNEEYSIHISRFPTSTFNSYSRCIHKAATSFDGAFNQLVYERIVLNDELFSMIVKNYEDFGNLRAAFDEHKYDIMDRVVMLCPDIDYKELYQGFDNDIALTGVFADVSRIAADLKNYLTSVRSVKYASQMLAQAERTGANDDEESKKCLIGTLPVETLSLIAAFHCPEHTSDRRLERLTHIVAPRFFTRPNVGAASVSEPAAASSPSSPGDSKK